MSFSAILIQGNIVSSEVLERIRTEDIRFQTAKDFKLPLNTSVRDEISMAWSLALSHWEAFKKKREKITAGNSGITETRRYWMLPFLSLLGYEMSASTAEIINGKTYAISHRATNLDGFPIHIVGIFQSLDKRMEMSGPRLSPHALTQEYLNNQEHLYGLVTNGMFLRLLRDSTRLSRFSYLEFNLEQIMEEQLYAEFALLFRSLHATRVPQEAEAGKECILEYYHEEAIALGSRIRDKLSDAVETSIKEIATSFLQHPANDALRHSIANGILSAREYYVYNLRLIYRLLFLMVIEERKLVYAESKDSFLESKRKIYYTYYSIQRITALASKKIFVDPDKSDLWCSTQACFSLFEDGRYGNALGISPLGSGLFSPTALGILTGQMLTNKQILSVMRHLTRFKNEQDQWVRVNYADLDVEEFGSVYEGLLEYQPEIVDSRFILKTGSERRDTSSHYTPEDLVKPLIQHSLDYLIQDRLKSNAPEAALLSLKVCDAACGSGHILLSAARRIGLELARLRSGGDQPVPSLLRHAVGDAIRNCIYGVDKNPLAVELCKVALWLEAHEPGQPLNFLDHHIKCGDAIIGLGRREELKNGIATEAFKVLHNDNKEIAASLFNRNRQERKISESSDSSLQLTTDQPIDKTLQESIAQYKIISDLPENNPEQIYQKSNSYQRYLKGSELGFLKAMADLQVAQFFIPKTADNINVLITDANYRLMLNGLKNPYSLEVEKATVVAKEHQFFHWFIEFPEVFDGGGFDCILGNPPFLGNRDLSGKFGEAYLNWATTEFRPAGSVDLVTYFFRRIFQIIKNGGFQALISTNTIAQGVTREGGLKIILENKGVINFAIRTKKWPGSAKVSVSLVSIFKGNWSKEIYLDNKKANSISSYLDDDLESTSFPLQCNENIAFQGSVVLGDGFILTPSVAAQIIESNPRNSEVLFPYLDGDDFNSTVDQSATRWIIQFDERSYDEIKDYEIPFEIVERKVYPERQKKDPGKYPRMVNEWWKFWMNRKNLAEQLSNKKKVLVSARVSKYFIVGMVPKNQVFHEKLVVFAYDTFDKFSVLQSEIHTQWAWKYRTTLESRLSYTPSNVFITFPFPKNLSADQTNKLESIGGIYHEYRKNLMMDVQLGLTKIYNLFNSKGISAHGVNYKDKNVAFLKKHLDKTSNTITLEQSIKGILQLRDLHQKMDLAVLESYDWNDLDLTRDFYEEDYLSENDRVRLTVHPDVRKEILARLLKLNHKIHCEETSYNETNQHRSKKKTKGDKNENKPSTQLLFPMRPETAYAPIYSAQDISRITKVSAVTIKRWLHRLYTEKYEGISKDHTTSGQPLLVNFYGVHELIVLYDLRVVNKIPLQDILDARKWLIERFGTGPHFYPFTSEKVLDTISKAGKQIIFTDEKKGDYITLGKGNAQLNLAFIKDFLRRLIFDKEMVSRLYLSDSETIAIDPSLAGGRPCTVHNEILIDSIKSVYMESKDIKYIARVYEISEEAVQDAVNFEQASVLN